MGMDRLRRVANVWNWLPAFRVVAEYQNIQKAAVVLSVSPSALSRTVRLLEDAIGETLFVRSASGLALTTFGGELLKGTREAMRRIDDVIAREETAGGERTFAAAATGAVLSRVLDRSLCAVVRELDGVRYRTMSVDEESIIAELQRGNLDLALVEAGPGFEVPDDLTCERIGDLEFAVLAPPTHPMADRSDEALALDAAVAPIVTIGAATPQDRTARTVATVGSMDSAESLAEHGPFLALLPPALAPTRFRVVARSAMRVSVSAIYRRPLEKQAPVLVRALVRALRVVVP